MLEKTTGCRRSSALGKPCSTWQNTHHGSAHQQRAVCSVPVLSGVQSREICSTKSSMLKVFVPEASGKSSAVMPFVLKRKKYGRQPTPVIQVRIEGLPCWSGMQGGKRRYVRA